MHGRMLDADTGALIGEGEVQFNDERLEGNIACVLKAGAWKTGPDEYAIVELESGERLHVVIVGMTGPYVRRHGDGLEEVGLGITSFRVRRE